MIMNFSELLGSIVMALQNVKKLLNIREIAPRIKRCEETNLVAVNNGIFNYDTKALLGFTPNLVVYFKIESKL